MTLVERHHALAPEQARAITDQIKAAVEATWQLIAQAYAGRAWTALGYASWDDYCTHEFGSSRLRLPREERQDVVASLRDSGLSTRAIAAAIGTNPMTVSRDLAGVPNVTPAEVDAAWESSARVTGVDGKSYPEQRPAPAVPRRNPLPDAASTAGWALRKAVERLERIHADDRFGPNKEQVATHTRGHLAYAVEVCQDLLDQLDH